MAITFDVADCTDFQKHFPDQGPENDREWSPLFYALTMIMLLIGPPTKDIDEFWTRVNIYQRTVGALAHRRGPDDKPECVYVTEEQAKSLAGLKINISPVSNKAFNQKLAEVLRTSHKRGWLK